jgi:putative membrane protein
MASEPVADGRAGTPTGARRLHPASLLFTIGRTMRALLLPALIALISKSAEVWAIVALLLGVPAIGFAVFRFFTLRWSLRADELYVEEGLWFRSARHVPYARIQDVDLVQGVLHRLLGVAEVRVQTGGGSEPEATLRVLALADVEALRSAVRSQGGAATSPEATEAPRPARELLVGEIPPGRLIVLGLVTHRGLAIVGGAFALLYEADLIERLVDTLPLGAWFKGLAAQGSGAILAVLLLTAVALFVFVVLSVVWSLVRFGGYRLEKAGDVLHLQCGLLTRVAASVPLARIQSLTVEASWVHRIFGCATIVARTAGGATADGDPSAAIKERFVPIVPAAVVPSLVEALLPQARLEEAGWQPLAAGAVRRAARKAVLVVLALTAPILVAGLAVLGWQHTFPIRLGMLVLGTGAGVVAGLSAARTRWARLPWGFAFRRGLLTQRTTLLPADRIQTVRTSESPFDRRHAHATLTLDAAGGTMRSSEVRAAYLEAAQACALHADLSAAAAATEYHAWRAAP